MEISISPHPKNNHPLGAILVKGPSAAHWISEIQRMGFSLPEIRIFPVPGTAANSIWGCMIIPSGKINAELIGKNEFCQRISPNLYIAERSVLHPVATPAEIESLFTTISVIHPEFGMAELTEPLDLQALLAEPELKSVIVTRPDPSAFIPAKVNSFQIQPLPPEEILRNMEEKIFPKQEKLEDEPLKPVEKVKLNIFRRLFKKTEQKPVTEGEAEGNWRGYSVEKTELLRGIESLISNITGRNDHQWSENMQQQFEDLEKRNREAVERLLDMLKNNPEEALKYAIPLDMDGSMRGEESGGFSLTKRWSDFSLLSPNSRSGGGTVDLSDHFQDLHRQYNETAEKLIASQEYQKAAFVYMKLLKNHYKAAETLENAKFYQEAATIYLKHANQKAKAAECYEKGNMIMEAIELYKQMNSNEKVGDLYLAINKRNEAMVYFGKEADKYTESHQYIRASVIYKQKMQDDPAGQAILMRGWNEGKDAVNCLTHYFDDIHDLKTLKREITEIYKAKPAFDSKQEQLLDVIRNEYSKNNELAETIRDMAYEIVSGRIDSNPAIVSMLKSFNREDRELVKDTIRYSVKGKDRMRKD